MHLGLLAASATLTPNGQPLTSPHSKTGNNVNLQGSSPFSLIGFYAGRQTWIVTLVRWGLTQRLKPLFRDRKSEDRSSIIMPQMFGHKNVICLSSRTSCDPITPTNWCLQYLNSSSKALFPSWVNKDARRPVDTVTLVSMQLGQEHEPRENLFHLLRTKACRPSNTIQERSTRQSRG